jgi:glycosyltransferase involved in cell wall biosynthesis
MVPSLTAVSETWMIRMLEMLEPHVALIACDDVSGQWHGIDTFCLNRKDIPSRSLRKLVGQYPTLMLLKIAIKKRKIRKILINYATMAVETRRAWADLNVEVFVHCHGVDVHFDAKSEQWPHQNIHPANYLEAVRKLAGRVIFIANSQHTKNILIQQGIAESSIRLKLFGVEDRGDTPKSHEANRPLKLLFLGRLVDCKGPDLVIKAFDLACARGLSAELIIAGDGHLLNTCELLKNDSPFKGRIKIHGPVDRDAAARLYREADIFVCHHRRGPISNREEAFGVTMIEAMSYGLPIITGRSGGVGESVVHGETGFLVEPGDINAYVEHLLRLGSNAAERTRIGANGIRHVRQNFSLLKEKQSLIKILGL